MHLRYQVIYLHLKGCTNRDIAKEEGFCQHTAGTYISKCNKDGPDELTPKPSPGAPRLLTPGQEKKLELIIATKNPEKVGFHNRKNWYINIVQEWVKNAYGVTFTPHFWL